MNLEQISSQDLNKIKKLEGFKRLEEVFDDPSFEEIRAEIEDLEPKIEEQIDYSELSNEQKVLLETIREFCTETSIEFKEKFWDLIKLYKEERLKISSKIIDYLQRKSFDLPNFLITHGEKAQRLLQEFKFKGYTISTKSLLLVIQLPKPLAQFWWKGGTESWGDKAIDVTGVIEWGHFYREVMPVIWRNLDYYEDEKRVEIKRINPKTQHDPKKYYYIWQIKMK